MSQSQLAPSELSPQARADGQAPNSDRSQDFAVWPTHGKECIARIVLALQQNRSYRDLAQITVALSPPSCQPHRMTKGHQNRWASPICHSSCQDTSFLSHEAAETVPCGKIWMVSNPGEQIPKRFTRLLTFSKLAINRQGYLLQFLTVRVLQYWGRSVEDQKNVLLGSKKYIVVAVVVPVVRHKAVAEVSKIGSLKERLVVVNDGWW